MLLAKTKPKDLGTKWETAVVRCVRMSGYHGFYRKAGTDKEYRF